LKAFWNVIASFAAFFYRFEIWNRCAAALVVPVICVIRDGRQDKIGKEFGVEERCLEVMG
jgi:hypothetical protein